MRGNPVMQVAYRARAGARCATPCHHLGGFVMITRVQIVFYSMYGHVFRMAEAVAHGVREVADTQALLYQVPELVPEEVLERSGARKAREAFAHIPVMKPEQLTDGDAIIFGTGTRFGNMTAQMRNFLD